jgi:hypothetical protein
MIILSIKITIMKLKTLIMVYRKGIVFVFLIIESAVDWKNRSKIWVILETSYLGIRIRYSKKSTIVVAYC